ncbi:MAG: type IV toxin-antitoxin system AbiEi family antitoxin domain-containing protein [bacterium]
MMKAKSVDVMRFLPVLFRYSDTLKLVSNPNVFLTRALKAGYVKRIARGIYYNTFKELPQVEEVACFVRTPSYISCEWALNAHGVILQVPSVCSAITLSPSVGKRNTVTYKGIVIEYSKIAERLFRGYETKGGFNMAAPEKALLDAVYLRGFIPFADELEIERLHIKQLNKWLPLYPKSVRQKLDPLFQ